VLDDVAAHETLDVLAAERCFRGQRIAHHDPIGERDADVVLVRAHGLAAGGCAHLRDTDGLNTQALDHRRTEHGSRGSRIDLAEALVSDLQGVL
jgi:hypothetical protein